MPQQQPNPWPALPYDAFAPTAYLLHMSVQALGKLKLTAPFEPHWDHVPLWLTTNGLSTGLIPYKTGNFSVELDFIQHRLTCQTSWEQNGGFDLAPRSVAEFTQLLFKTLSAIGVDLSINTKPQEVRDPIPFEQDTKPRPYQAELANTWWRILVYSQQVMERHHARFLGRTPPIGLMWGTFDLRDVRYSGKKIHVDNAKMDYISRNAMDVEMIEIGWWPGNETWPRPAYFSFTYPQPAGMEQAVIKPAKAEWNKELLEFIINYDDIRQAPDPAADLLAFFETTYAAGAAKAGWDANLICSGKPV